MATDATGTPTAPDSIPTYNTSVDAPSGLGFNAAMAAIQTALSGRWLKSLFTTVGDIAYASGVSTPARLGIGSTGTVLTVAGGVPTWAAPTSGGEIAYQEFTSTVNCQSGTAVSPITIVTAPAITADGSTKYRIEFFCTYYSMAASTTLEIDLYEGSTNLGILSINNLTGTIPGGTAFREYIPAAGSRTFSVRGFCSPANVGGPAAGAGGVTTTFPGYIRVTRA